MHEVNLNKARLDPIKFPTAALDAGIQREMDKAFIDYNVYKEITNFKEQVQPNALFIPLLGLCKQKYHADGSLDKISFRLALNGTFQKPGDFGDTYAATSDEASTLALMCAFQADGIKHNYVNDIEYEKCDVRGAFLHCKLVSPRQIITRMPTNINHPMAGKMCIVVMSVYGLKGSNIAFYTDFSSEIVKAGFTKSLDPCIFYKIVAMFLLM